MLLEVRRAHVPLLAPAALARRRDLAAELRPLCDGVRVGGLSARVRAEEQGEGTAAYLGVRSP